MIRSSIGQPIVPPIGNPLSGGGLPWDGAGGAALWTPAALGAKLKIWARPSTLSSGTYLDAVTSWATGGYGIAAFAGAGSARPYLDTAPMLASSWVQHFDGSNDFVASTSVVNDIIETTNGDRYRRMMVAYVESVSGTHATNAWTNCGIVSDAAGWLGTHLRDMTGGQYRVQGFQYAGAAKVATPDITLDCGKGPIVIDQWYDGTNLNCAVYYNGTWTTATPVASAAISGSAALRMGVSSAGAAFFGGMICEVVAYAGDMADADVTLARDYLIRQWQAAAPVSRYQATTAKAWGNTEAGGTLPLAPAFSSASMQVLETDSSDIDVRAYQNAASLSDSYPLGSIMRGDTGTTAPTTEIAAVGPASSAITYRTGQVALGGTGSRRVFAVSGPKTGSTGTMVSEVWVRAGATTTHVTQPSDRVVYVDGYGGATAAADGYSATAGVIDGGAAAALRTAYMAKIAALSLGANDTVIMMRGTNDMAAGTAASDFQVGVDQWWQDVTASVTGSTIILGQIVRRTAYEASTAPGYRTAVSTVGTARSVAVIAGLAIYAVGDLGADGTHPLIAKQGQHVTAIMAALTTAGHASTGKVVLWCDSIGCGSSDPAAYNAARGLPMLLRQARRDA